MVYSGKEGRKEGKYVWMQKKDRNQDFWLLSLDWKGDEKECSWRGPEIRF